MPNETAPVVSINGRHIGPDHPTYFIAEACDNHFGSLDNAKEMARRAKLAGSDAIKFQHHIADEEMLEDSPSSSNFSEPLYDFLKKNALSINQHEAIFEYCKSINIQYICTPFSYRAAEELVELGVSVLKIGSGELSDIPTLRRIASNFGLPMILSTGMSSFEEIDATYTLLSSHGIDLAFLNCVSEYPPDYHDLNLRVISELKHRYRDVVIGHSDHTPDIFTSFAAVTLGASIIEKHVTLDKRLEGPDQAVSIDFTDVALLIEGTRKIEAAMGNIKKIHKKEEEIRAWALRSLVTIADIQEGEIFTYDNVWSKRPGTGILSRHIDQVIGSTSTKKLAANHLITWSDVASIDPQ